MCVDWNARNTDPIARTFITNTERKSRYDCPDSALFATNTGIQLELQDINIFKGKFWISL
jgi:hypothetical protein